MIEFISLTKSTKPDKKLKATFKVDGKRKVVHFGSKTSKTFLDHRDNQKKKNFRARHHKNIIKFIDDPFAPMTLSNILLWNKKTLKESLEDYLKAYGIKHK